MWLKMTPPFMTNGPRRLLPDDFDEDAVGEGGSAEQLDPLTKKFSLFS